MAIIPHCLVRSYEIDYLTRSSKMLERGDSHMRAKVREIPCRDEDGAETLVVEWRILPVGMSNQNACCREYALPDGTPVALLGGKFEHFYSGKMFTPI